MPQSFDLGFRVKSRGNYKTNLAEVILQLHCLTLSLQYQKQLTELATFILVLVNIMFFSCFGDQNSPSLGPWIEKSGANKDTHEDESKRRGSVFYCAALLTFIVLHYNGTCTILLHSSGVKNVLE